MPIVTITYDSSLEHLKRCFHYSHYHFVKDQQTRLKYAENKKTTGWFVKRRSRQVGFSGVLQHVVLVIRLLRSYVSQKSLIWLLLKPTFKSPSIIRFSQFDEYKAKDLLVSSSDNECYFCFGRWSSKVTVFSSSKLFLRGNLQQETFHLPKL